MNSPKQLAVGTAARIALGLEGLVRPRTRADPHAAKSVLVLEYLLPLGSCVHMTPVYEALKRTRPEMIVTVATRGLALGMLRHSPFLDHLIETPDPLSDLPAAIKSLSQQLRARGLRPDCCLTGVPDQRTKIALLGMRVCDGWRGGYTVHGGMYHRPLYYDWSISQIANNLRVPALLGYTGGTLEPKVFYTRADAAAARTMLERARSSDTSEARPVLTVISRNSGGLPTAWHDERWAEVIRYASGTLGYGIVYVGTAADVPGTEVLRALAGGIGISLAGATSVGQLGALLAQSDMVITIDTGGMHMTRAVGTPMVILGLAWERPLQWLALDRKHVRILRGPELAQAPEGYRLDDISSEWAMRELADMTRMFPASEAARETRLASGLSSLDLLAQAGKEA